MDDGELLERCPYGVRGLGVIPSSCRRPLGHDGGHERLPRFGGPPLGSLPEETALPADPEDRE